MDTDRRDFLRSAALATAPVFIPRKVWGANDRVTYGVIATGGRGRYLNNKFQSLGAQCAALCDVYEPNLELAVKDSPAAKTYVEYRELLERKDLDAVILAGPDHHHCPMLLESLSAGKDIYAEKPLSKTLEESAKMVNAVRKSKQVVQIGMQRRSADAIMKAKQLVDDGALGFVSMVKPQWHWNVSRPLDNSPLPGKIDWTRFLGNAPKRPVTPMRYRRWRYFWDYAGGNMTDQGTHLMDVVQWFMRSGPPKSAVCYGYVGKMEGAEHPDVFSAVFEFEKFMATWTLDYSNSYENGWSITFMGDRGTMILDEKGYRVYAEPWKPENPPTHQEDAPVPVEAHIQNFLDCIKSRKDPNCTVEIAQAAVAGPHLANIALVKGRRMHLGSDMVKVS
ncbi:MAG: Gfo/Idh/MocA family oxidoreductase [Bryobacteraceae bacterium]|nr:Gfo/Idh/MocA family oxidoreductase [Bryobacteraceae bacterium]